MRVDDSEGADPVDREPGAERPDPVTFVRTALIFYGLMGCAALFWRMSTPGASILHPTAAEPQITFLVAGLLGTALGGAAIGVSEILTRFTSLGEALADVLGEGLAGIGRWDALLLALASGLAEEMFFRGALQPAVGLALASFIFGACHFLSRRELVLWSAYAVVMGFAFGALFEWTGQLVAPIAAHVVVNGVNLPRLAERARLREIDAARHQPDPSRSRSSSPEEPPQGDTPDDPGDSPGA